VTDTARDAWRRTHYQRLGVRADATADDIRRAYRRRARDLHPDHHAQGDPRRRAAAATEMAAVNEAWRVLRDPAARRRYDASLRVTPFGAGPAGPARTTTVEGPPPHPGERLVRGVPWLLLVVVLVLIFVFTAFAGSVVDEPGDAEQGSATRPPGGGAATQADAPSQVGAGGVAVGRLTSGDCVAVVDGRTVREVPCEGAEATVVFVLGPSQPCPVGLESYARPEGGAGRLCVRRR